MGQIEQFQHPYNPFLKVIIGAKQIPECSATHFQAFNIKIFYQNINSQAGNYFFKRDISKKATFY